MASTVNKNEGGRGEGRLGRGGERRGGKGGEGGEGLEGKTVEPQDKRD